MTEKPSLRDRTRPAELLGLSGGFALFVGLVVILSTRQPVLALIAVGVTFILALVTLATLALTANASDAEKIDLDEQDKGQLPPRGH